MKVTKNQRNYPRQVRVYVAATLAFGFFSFMPFDSILAANANGVMSVQQQRQTVTGTVKDANGLSCVKVTFDSGILFATNSSDLNASAKHDLTKFAGVLRQNSDCDVAIQGYTDASGNDNINIPLSERRAKSVSNYLRGQGVSSAQIRTVEGLGSSNPIENKRVSQANRRVEVYMYASKEMINKANNGNL